MERKRGQHYVWRYYLTAWADHSDQVACLRDNKVFSANPKNIAKARDFYRLRDLNPQEIEMIEKGFINDFWTPQIQQLNRNWVNLFTRVFKIRQHLNHTGRLNDAKEAQLDRVINDLAEDFHSHIEGEYLQCLDSLKSGNIDFLKSSEGKHKFMFFLCLQYFRTNMMKNTILRSFEAGPRPVPPELIRNLWSVLYFIFATNLAFSLSSDKSYRVLILRNTSPIPFITGDQPVINTRVNYSVYEQAQELELYYPVSPELAVLVTDSNTYDSHQTTFNVQEREVKRYNELISNASDEQIYANDVNVLQDFTH